VEEYWTNLVSQLGPAPLLVDTSAILGYFERGNDRFQEFFATATGYRYVTTTYVVTEACRRLVKSNTPSKHLGPHGEACKELSWYLISQWLDDQQVTTICLPKEAFEFSLREYRRLQGIRCDLTDIISYTVVKGLKRGDLILADDMHFRELGIDCLP